MTCSLPPTRSATTRSPPSATSTPRAATPSDNARTASPPPTSITTSFSTSRSTLSSSPLPTTGTCPWPSMPSRRAKTSTSKSRHAHPGGNRGPHPRRPLRQANPAMRHAAAQLEPLSRCRRPHSGRQPRPCAAGQDLLVAELSRIHVAQGRRRRHPSPRLDAVARRRSPAALQRRKISSLAPVLEFWRLRPEGFVHPLAPPPSLCHLIPP